MGQTLLVLGLPDDLNVTEVSKDNAWALCLETT